VKLNVGNTLPARTKKLSIGLGYEGIQSLIAGHHVWACQQGECANCAYCSTRQGHNTQQQSGLKQGWPYTMFQHQSLIWNPLTILKVQHKQSAFYSMILGVDSM